MAHPDDQDVLIGRAVRRLLEIASQDETARLGLEALARSVLGVETVLCVEMDVAVEVAPADAPATELVPEVPTTPDEPATSEPAEPAEPARPDAADEPVEPIEPIDESTLQVYVEEATLGVEGEEFGPLALALRRAAHIPELTPAPGTAEPAPARPEAATEVPATSTGVDAVLPALAERTRLKAAVSRSLAEHLATGTPLDDRLVHDAKSARCTLWILDLVDPDPRDLALLADSLDAVADGAELAHLLRGQDPLDRVRFARTVRGFAAVQSTLRVVATRLRGRMDEDQVVAFQWAKDTTAAERIFVRRHMKLEDPLPPEDLPGIWATLAADLAAVHADVEALHVQADRAESRLRGLRQVRYHAGRIAKGKGTAHDRDKIVEAVVELVDDGLPVSNLDLRALLLPILDGLPPAQGESAAYARVIADLERERDRQRREGAQPATPKRAPKPRSDAVRRVAELLHGTELVVIGGERRIEAERALTDAFGLSELTWFMVSDDPTLDELERAISSPDVSVVLQLIRWSRHRHGDADEIADRYGKPFVRIKGGYNPNAVARAILDQASERLAAGPR